MSRDMLRRVMVVAASLAMFLVFSGCITIVELIIGSSADPNSEITATMTVEMDEAPCGCPGGGPSAGLVAIMIPDDWTIDELEYDGDYGPEFMEWLHPDSLDRNPEAGTDAWYDSLNTIWPPPAGMHWEVYQSPLLHPWIGDRLTSTTTTINMTTGAEGTHALSFYASTTDYGFTPDSNWSVIHDVTVSLTGIEENTLPGVAQSFALDQNFPNPFNPSTTIRYAIKDRAEVKLAVYNTAGQEVAVLAQGEKTPGNYEVVFDAENLPSGVYLYRLTAGKFVETRKMMLIQ